MTCLWGVSFLDTNIQRATLVSLGLILEPKSLVSLGLMLVLHRIDCDSKERPRVRDLSRLHNEFGVRPDASNTRQMHQKRSLNM